MFVIVLIENHDGNRPPMLIDWKNQTIFSSSKNMLKTGIIV